MKVLFVVTAFYPEQAIGSIRTTKFAKYLTRNGVDVSVISLAPPPWAARDDTLWFPELRDMRWDTIDQSRLFKKVFQRARIATIGKGSAVGGARTSDSRPSLKSSVRENAQLVYTMLKAFDWKYRVRSHVQKHFAKERFDIIYCSYPSLASPFSAIMLKEMGIGRHLVMDFRDPVCVTNAGFVSVRKWIQRYLIRNSDLRLYISVGQRNAMIDKLDEAHDKVVNNGYDPEDMFGIEQHPALDQDRRLLRFVYTGSVYGGKRDLGPFFSAVSEIIRKTEHTPESFIFEYAGSEGASFQEYATSFGLDHRVTDHGRLTRTDALQLQKSADICLLATWNTDVEQGVLTGKVFEYFMLRKPILAIVSGDRRGSEVGRIIDRLDAGHCFESAAPEQLPNLEEWISSALDEKLSKGCLSLNYNEGVNEFNQFNIFKNLYSEMESLLTDE